MPRSCAAFGRTLGWGLTFEVFYFVFFGVFSFRFSNREPESGVPVTADGGPGTIAHWQTLFTILETTERSGSGEVQEGEGDQVDETGAQGTTHDALVRRHQRLPPALFRTHSFKPRPTGVQGNIMSDTAHRRLEKISNQLGVQVDGAAEATNRAEQERDFDLQQPSSSLHGHHLQSLSLLSTHPTSDVYFTNTSSKKDIDLPTSLKTKAVRNPVLPPPPVPLPKDASELKKNPWYNEVKMLEYRRLLGTTKFGKDKDPGVVRQLLQKKMLVRDRIDCEWQPSEARRGELDLFSVYMN